MRLLAAGVVGGVDGNSELMVPGWVSAWLCGWLWWLGCFLVVKLGGKCVFFEKKCVFGVDKWGGIGYIRVVPCPKPLHR